MKEELVVVVGQYCLACMGGRGGVGPQMSLRCLCRASVPMVQASHGCLAFQCCHYLLH